MPGIQYKNRKIRNYLADLWETSKSLGNIFTPYSIINTINNKEFIGLSMHDPWGAVRKILSRLRLGVHPCRALQQDFALAGEGAFAVGAGWRGKEIYQGTIKLDFPGPDLPAQFLRPQADGCIYWGAARTIGQWTIERIMVRDLGGVILPSVHTGRICFQRSKYLCFNPDHLVYYKWRGQELILVQGTKETPPFLLPEVQRL